MLLSPNVPAENPSAAHSQQDRATELRDAVQVIMAGTQHECRVSERRREHRTPYPYLIKLAPAAADGQPAADEEIVVVGKHLSTGGIDFYHREPIPHRWMIAWLESGGQLHSVLVELLWCRFNKQGWYENGGRFVRLVGGTRTLPRTSA